MYVFDNAAPNARARLAALADLHDPGTIRHLLATGVTDGGRALRSAAAWGRSPVGCRNVWARPVTC